MKRPLGAAAVIARPDIRECRQSHNSHITEELVRIADTDNELAGKYAAALLRASIKAE